MCKLIFFSYQNLEYDVFLGHPTISWRSRDIVDIFSISDIGAEGLCHCCSTHRYRNIGGRFPASVKSSALHGRPPRPQGGFPHWKIEGNRLKKAIPIYSSVASLTWKKNQIPMFKKDKSKVHLSYTKWSICIREQGPPKCNSRSGIGVYYDNGTDLPRQYLISRRYLWGFENVMKW